MGSGVSPVVAEPTIGKKDDYSCLQSQDSPKER